MHDIHMEIKCLRDDRFMDYDTLWRNLQNKKFFTEIILKKNKLKFSGENCYASQKENPRNGKPIILLNGPFNKGVFSGNFITIKEKDIVSISYDENSIIIEEKGKTIKIKFM